VSTSFQDIGLGQGDWSWTREPERSSPGGSAELQWTCASGSDFWRHTASGEVNHNGHGYVVRVADDFVLEGQFEVDFGARYDQAGLIALASESVWVKAGVELERDLLVGAVHTDGHSDWSFGPGSIPAGIRMERKDGTLEISWQAEGEQWRAIRQLHLEGPVAVGPYSCAPLGPGFETRLSSFVLRAVPEAGA
jgi:uncharacterized protein